MDIDELRRAFALADEHAAKWHPNLPDSAPERQSAAYAFVRGWLGVEL
jgi:hypothetical protein